MRDQLMTYGLVMGKRLRKKDKQVFLEEMTKDLKQHGCQLSFVKKKELLHSSTHMIINDLEKAKIVYCCPYDTPGKMVVPHATYTPFHLQHNQKVQTTNLLLQSLLAILLLIIAGGALSVLLRSSLPYQILAWLIAILCSIVAIVLFRGLDNRVNFNRCSASVVLLRQCAIDLSSNRDVALILVDQATTSFAGLRQLQQAFPDLQTKVMVWVDSLATGSTLVAAVSPTSQQLATTCTKRVPECELQVRLYSPQRIETTPLSLFPNMIMIGSGDVEKKELVVRNAGTKQDYHVNLPRLELIKTWLETASQLV